MRDRKILHRLILLSSVAMSLIAITLGIWYSRDAALDLTWRWFSLPLIASLFAVISTTAVLIFGKTTRRSSLYWFVLIPISNIFLLVVTLGQSLSATPEAAALWQSMLPATWVGIPALLLLFTLSYVDETPMPLRLSSWVAVVTTVVSIVFFAGATDLFEYHTPTAEMILRPWGYQNVPGDYQFIPLAWATLLCLMSVFVLVGAYRQATDVLRKRQLRIFLFGVAQYVALAFTMDFIVFTLFPDALPPAGFIYATVLSVTVAYGIYKYGLFSISPVSLADQILDQLSEAVIGVNPDFKVEFANQGTRAILGQSAASLRGKSLWNIFDAHTVAAIQAEIAANTRSTTINELHILASRGNKTVPVNVTVSKVYNERKTLGGYIFVIQNISELERKSIELAHEKASVERKVVRRTKELHEERARLQSSIESIALGFVLIDERNTIIIQNNILRSILDTDKDIATINELARRIDGLDFNAYCKQLRTTTKPPKAKEFSYGKKVLRIFGTRTGSESQDIVLLIEDITEVKVLERSRDEFFSIASHELRTPLTAIRGNASMMLQYYPDEMKNPELQATAVDIHDSSVRLIEIVNDFLDVSRLEQSKMSFKPVTCNIQDIIENVLYEMKYSIRDKGIKIEYDGATRQALPTVWADPNRLKQVVYNLLGNAIKFSDDGTVRIQVRKHGDFMRVSIQDEGRGIPVAMQKLLFHKFQQAGESLLTRDTTRGTGLGLYISKLIIQNSGGHIELVRSEPGKGATFAFTMPVKSTEKG